MLLHATSLAPRHLYFGPRASLYELSWQHTAGTQRGSGFSQSVIIWRWQNVLMYISDFNEWKSYLWNQKLCWGWVHFTWDDLVNENTVTIYFLWLRGIWKKSSLYISYHRRIHINVKEIGNFAIAMETFFFKKWLG